MNKPVAKAILEAASNLGFEMTHREGYSGRGMYGETTDAIVYESLPDLLTCIAIAAIDVFEAEEYAEKHAGQVELTAEDFSMALRKFRFDSMGRSSSIAY